LTFLNNTFSDLDLSPYQRDLANFKNEMQNYMNKKVYLLASVIEKIAPAGNALTHFISFFVIMPISFFYFLRDWKAMSSAIFECIPNRQRDICLEVAVVIRTSLQNFLGGQMYVALILSAYYTAALFAADLEDRVFFGILSGVASFVPCIGALFSFALVVFINATALTLTKLYMLVASYFVGQFLETYLLYPHFIGKKTKLHPLWILFSFFAGLELKGIIGVLMAIPLTAVARAVIVFAVDKFKSTQAYKQ
jgi:predicted PurR-regulated permease PerM